MFYFFFRKNLKNNCARTYFGEFALAHLTFGWCTSPTDNFPFTYHNCAVDYFQRFIFSNSQSPEKFTGKPKIVSLLTSSQESIKHKLTFTFTFTLRTIYEVNVKSWYLERYSPATDNEAIFAILLHHQEDIFSKLMVENRSKIYRNKSIPNKW